MSNPLRKTMVYLGLADEEYDDAPQAAAPAPAASSAPTAAPASTAGRAPVTPLRRLSGISLIRFRRMLGLTAFYYALAHLAVYLLLDRQLNWAEIGGDLYKRPYIMFGMAAFVLIVPLAATSNGYSLRRLGAAAWQKLHRLAYPAAILMVLHYLWLVKSWTLEPLAYAAITLAVLATRLVPRKPGRAAG